MVICPGMMFFKVKKSFALALVGMVSTSALAVSETRKITIPAHEAALPSLETTTTTAFEHPTATHIPMEEISAISEIMDDELEGATETIDSDFLTASDQ